MASHKSAVLDYLKHFKTITTFEAFAELGITRLAAVIYELKKDGYEFSVETLKQNNRYGKAVYFAKYSLLEDIKNGNQ